MTQSGTRPDRPAGPAAVPADSAATPAIDPVSVIRSRAYLSALVLAALLGIPISAVAYGFLAAVSEDPGATSSPTCPTSCSGAVRRPGGRSPGWCCAVC